MHDIGYDKTVALPYIYILHSNVTWKYYHETNLQ